MDLETVVRESWGELLQWVQQKRIKPVNEEEIQCFIYHGIIKRLGDANHVKPKHTSGKPPKLFFKNGKLITGNMHFPDLLIGENGEIVIEIKFMRESRESKIFAGCKLDICKMKEHHPDKKRFFVLFDACADNIFLSEHQMSELQVLDTDCEILFYPPTLNNSKRKESAKAAIDSLKARGYDFVAQGKKSAEIAIKGKF